MAKVNIKMPEEFLMKISRLGSKTDEIVTRVLEAGGEIVLDKMKANLSSGIGNDTKLPRRSTGELVSALGVSPALVDGRGNHNVKVVFNEPRREEVSNVNLANIVEYGKSGQHAKPFLKPARRTSRQPCMDAMIKKLEEEVESI